MVKKSASKKKTTKKKPEDKKSPAPTKVEKEDPKEKTPEEILAESTISARPEPSEEPEQPVEPEPPKEPEYTQEQLLAIIKEQHIALKQYKAALEQVIGPIPPQLQPGATPSQPPPSTQPPPSQPPPSTPGAPSQPPPSTGGKPKPGTMGDFDKRLDNLEISFKRLIEMMQNPGGTLAAAPSVPGAPGVPGQPSSDFYQKLGPLAPLVVNALKPEDPYNTLGKALVNNQIALMTNPDPNPLEAIGQTLVDHITKQGITGMLTPTESLYERKYMEKKAALDAARDAK